MILSASRITAFQIRIYSFCLLLAYSRGAAELVIGKLIGYQIQFSSLLMVLLIFLPFLLVWIRSNTMLFLLMLAVVLISVSISDLLFFASLTVAVVNLINVFFLIISISILKNSGKGWEFFESEGVRGLDRGLRLVVGYVLTCAVLDFLGAIDFPGDAEFGELTRMSGSLGSKQHLSVLLGILSLLMASSAWEKKSSIDMMICVVSIIVLFATLTRIGYVIFIGVVVWFVISGLVRGRKSAAKFLFVSLVACGSTVGVLGVYFPDIVGATITRVSQIDVSEGSNVSRMSTWGAGLELYSSGNLLVGVNSGFSSQIAAAIFSIKSSHFESGQIQYLNNFGLIFFIIIAFLFYKFYRYLPAGSLLKSLPVVMWVGLFIYMFNEIVPIFVTFPLIAIVAVRNQLKCEGV